MRLSESLNTPSMKGLRELQLTYIIKLEVGINNVSSYYMRHSNAFCPPYQSYGVFGYDSCDVPKFELILLVIILLSSLKFLSLR